MTRLETAGMGGKKPRRMRGLRRKYKRRRAAPKARPTEKGNLRRDKGGGKRGHRRDRGLHITEREIDGI